MKTVRIKDGFLTIADTDAFCPNCKNKIQYRKKDLTDYDDTYVYKICKGCRKKVGISTDYMGDIVTWLKTEERK